MENSKEKDRARERLHSFHARLLFHISRLNELTMWIGDIQVDRIVDLDCGVLPKRGFPGVTVEQWERYAAQLGPRFIDPVDLNVIISFHAYLVRTGGLTVLIDTCVGADKDRTPISDWHMRRSTAFIDNLATAGVTVDDIDVVMCTHMHADHVGWNTRSEDGRWVPTFPKARYLMSELEFDYMRRNSASLGRAFAYGCFEDSVLPIVKAGQAEIVLSDHVLRMGIHMEHVPGHTPGSSLIHLESGRGHAICIGDVLQHPFQLFCPEMPTSFCEDPALAALQRVKLCEEYSDTDTIILTGHFPAPSMGKIIQNETNFAFEFVNE